MVNDIPNQETLLTRYAKDMSRKMRSALKFNDSQWTSSVWLQI